MAEIIRIFALDAATKSTGAVIVAVDTTLYRNRAGVVVEHAHEFRCDFAHKRMPGAGIVSTTDTERAERIRAIKTDLALWLSMKTGTVGGETGKINASRRAKATGDIFAGFLKNL